MPDSQSLFQLRLTLADLSVEVSRYGFTTPWTLKVGGLSLCLCVSHLVLHHLDNIEICQQPLSLHSLVKYVL